jgi:23S rRNA (adenine2503-C2)-methyltransferase
MEKQYFLDLERAGIEKLTAEWGLPSFRAKQLMEWVYQKRVDSFAAFTNLPAELRQKLDSTYRLRAFEIKGKQVSVLDGTVRYHLAAGDGAMISAVFLPSRDRASVCISTQAGCSVGCLFCATGKTGFKRNLSRGEILEQILLIERDTGRKINGVLLMGMGEPLLNYTNVVAALKAMVDPGELGIGRRHITVSTVGIVPKIRQLADEQVGVRLALSLHAPDDETRKKIIPDAIRHSVAEILEAGLFYSRQTNGRLTIEYILIPGVNDALQAAQKLVKLIKDAAAAEDEVQVNLIPCNETPGGTWTSPSSETIDHFRDHLIQNGLLAIIREAKGADIGAACGQLGY